MDMTFPAQPINLRDDVWQFLVRALENASEEELRAALPEEELVLKDELSHAALLEQIVEDPGAFLVAAGILKYPELLRDTVVSIEIEPGLNVDYILKEKTIAGLKNRDSFLIVYRLLDNEELVIREAQLMTALKTGGTFDYIEATST